MTRRRFLRSLLGGPILAGLGVWGPMTASAQSQRRATDDVRRQRPTNKPLLEVKKLSPQLETILNNWEKATSHIDTLQGKHHRFVYDKVFEVEKRAEGDFFYQAPDNGRIDIQAGKIRPSDKSRRIGAGGKPFKLQSDRPERWICDGKQILQINEAEKTVETFPIPPQVQGRNIMEGPLPFLFGMPAAEAKRRYFLKVLKITETQIWLGVKPRRKQDAANWKEAKVILQKRNYLPWAVQLIDPAGNLETVYRFSDLEVNARKLPLPWRGNPFQPRLIGYKRIKAGPAGPAVPTVPAVVGDSHEKAKETLEAAGYKVKFWKGRPATRAESVWAVYEQKPKPATPLAKGQTVHLTLYTKMISQAQ